MTEGLSLPFLRHFVASGSGRTPALPECNIVTFGRTIEFTPLRSEMSGLDRGVPAVSLTSPYVGKLDLGLTPLKPSINAPP